MRKLTSAFETGRAILREPSQDGGVGVGGGCSSSGDETVRFQLSEPGLGSTRGKRMTVWWAPTRQGRQVQSLLIFELVSG